MPEAITAGIRDERDHALDTPRQGSGLPQPLTEASLLLRATFCLLLVALAILASFQLPVVSGSQSPPDEYVVLYSLTGLTILIVFWLRRKLNVGAGGSAALPLPIYTLFLAAVILLGAAGGVILAAVASLHPLITDISRRPTAAKVVAVLRGGAVASVATLLAGAVFSGASLLVHVSTNDLHSHLLGGVGAALIILAGAGTSRILEQGWSALWSRRTWSTYLHSPAFRFQVLLLSIGPLLPLVAILDDVETELAWVLFLIPLYAIYYLSLLSVRLQERTDELQRTVQALALARERQAELTGYAALITQAQEEERRRLARELHDDTAQALIALSRGLDALAIRHTDPPLSPSDSHFLAELGLLAKRTLDGIRRACQNLRPSVLDDLGLAAALESLASSVAERGVACDYFMTGEPYPCAAEVEVTVYRIAQEGVTNALRHADATHVTISLTYAPDGVEVLVRDDGRGFDVSRQTRSAAQASESEKKSGLGLLGMRERAALVGATLDVESAPRQGTRVRVHVPLALQTAPDT